MSTICTHCGKLNDAQNRFCGKCGRPLPVVTESSSMTEIAMPPQKPEMTIPYGPPVRVNQPKKPTISGCVRFANGATVDLVGTQDFFVGRADASGRWFPTIDMAPHGGETGGVSRKHARLFFKEGAAYVEDLNSTNGTFLNETRLVANMPRRIQDGDVLRFGRLQVHFSMKVTAK